MKEIKFRAMTDEERYIESKQSFWDRVSMFLIFIGTLAAIAYVYFVYRRMR